MQKISQNVYVETGFRGSNDGLVETSEGLVLIDTPQFPTDAIKWRETVAKHGEVRYIIITEPHLDHFNGAFCLKGTVVGHEGTRQTIMATDPNQTREGMKGTEDYALMDGFAFRPPTITFNDEMTLYVGKHTFKLINMPGHTPYQAAVFIPEEKVMFTSDNVVYKVPPWLMQAMPDEWLQSLKRIATFDADVLVPGHGEVCDKSYLPEMAALVQEWIDAVKDAIKKGLTVEEAQKTITVLDRWELDPDRKQRMQQRNISHLYEVLKK